jgi:hypothetical protein
MSNEVDDLMNYMARTNITVRNREEKERFIKKTWNFWNLYLGNDYLIPDKSEQAYKRLMDTVMLIIDTPENINRFGTKKQKSHKRKHRRSFRKI